MKIANLFKSINCKILYIIICIAVLTWNVQTAFAQVVISEVFYDTPENEDQSITPCHNGEYIELYNNYGRPISLAGWKIKVSPRNEIYEFSSVTIAGKSTLVICYQYKDDNFLLTKLYPSASSGRVLYHNSFILPNKATTIYLINDFGCIIDEMSYEGNTGLFTNNGTSLASNCTSLQRSAVHYEGNISQFRTNDYIKRLANPSYIDPTNFTNMAISYPAVEDSKNYILTVTPTLPLSGGTLNKSNAMMNIQYFDGLGRKNQEIGLGVCPNGSDLISLQNYDLSERESESWLPVPIFANGVFQDSISIANHCKEYYGDSRPYSYSVYDDSPLDKIQGLYEEGEDWQNNKKGMTLEYTINTSINNCRCYKIGNTGNLVYSGFYALGDIYIVKSTDEDKKVEYNYINKRGLTVLNRKMNNSQTIDTYFVYNKLGLLCYVLSPMINDDISTASLDKYAYKYEYDEFNRCILKKVPGMQPIYFVYDKTDRLILSQNGNQRLKNTWLVNKYDKFGRLVYTSEVRDYSTHAQLMNSFKNWTIVESFSTSGHTYPQEDTGYSKGFYHAAPTKLLTVNYYDDYRFLDLLPSQDKSNLTYVTKTGYGAKYDNARGLLTGTRVYDLSNPSKYIITAFYYDSKGNVVQERCTNYLNGYDFTYYKYNFVGNVLESYKEHDVSMYNNLSSTEKYRYTYDHVGRILNTYYQYGAESEITLSENSYDDLGRLVNKYRHNREDAISYKYNIRDWITQITNGTFEEKLYYNSNPNNNGLSYNGNISAIEWKYNQEYNGYRFAYDPINRLINGSSSEGDGMVKWDNYYEENFSYDKNGNITNLFRSSKSCGTIDLLSAYYNGNQITSVFDEYGSSNKYNIKEYQDLATGVNFFYDANGNMIADLDRDIVTIKYNIINQPDTIQFKNGNQIINTYLADGSKVRTDYITYRGDIIIPLGQIFEWNFYYDFIVWYADFYLDNYVYRFNKEMDGTYLDLSKVYNPEGYKAPYYGNLYNYYYRKDHLGSIRETWCSQRNSVTQRLQYYPSGLPWDKNEEDFRQKNRFNGKEYIEEHGYNTYDYGARQYLPTIARFTTIDPHCESYYSVSPYAYCNNNPINLIDPSGMDWIKNRFNDYMWKDEAIDEESTPDGWTYVGLSLPDNVGRYDILEDINGKLYYKYTGNVFAKLVNWINGKSVMVEKKPYDPVEDHMMETFASVGGDLVVGGATSKVVGKVGGKVLQKVASKTSKVGGAAEKATEKVADAGAKVHGNSLKSTRPTWGYKLYKTETGEFLKNGITSKKIPETRYTKKFMDDKYMDGLQRFSNRKAAYDWEYQQNVINRGPLNKNMH